MPGSILGNAVRRVEDPLLLVGGGTYVDNLHPDGMQHVVFVRSPLAHAAIRSIDGSAAEGMPGVAAVLDGDALDLPAHHAFMALNDACKRPPLARGKVRFVGEAVVAVVADTVAHALDAAEAVVVDYDPLPAAIDAEGALEPSAPLQFDELGTNLVAGVRDAAGEEVLAGADVVVRGRFVNQRVAVAPIEGNAILVEPGDPLTIHVATQMPHAFLGLVTSVLGLPAGEVRVVTPHVGGAFGAKAGLMSEHTVAIAVARRLGVPVKWVETRSENMTAMPHGRGQVAYVELGLSADARITGMRVRVVGDAGAYGGFGGALALGPTRTMAQGVYRIPNIAYEGAVAVTNTTPVGAFRGAGRPEAAAYLERIIDMAADELGIDPVEIRKRNLLAPEEFPYRTLMGVTYDTGAYASTLDRALEVAGYDALRAEQRARRERGDRMQLGVGVSTYVEITAGGMSTEFGSVTVHADGSATITVGTSAHGQGHATSFAMIVSDRLGIPIERIAFVQSDTALVPRGSGTGGSRSLQIGGSAVHGAANAVLERARDVAAAQLEADPSDIVVTGEGLGVAGVPSSAVSWAQLASLVEADGERLEASIDFEQAGATFPFGAHVSVVEVDMETGLVRPLRHIAVDDCGRVLNPLIVQGQQHGGVAQGMAQALWEQFVYDAEGNPRTSTFAEYAIPSAAEVPSIEASNTETPTPLNPLGAKGIGESGTIGSMPAVQNAVVDALSHLGVRHVDMPCTPERVWNAIEDPHAAAWREPPAVFASLPTRGARPPAADVDI